LKLFLKRQAGPDLREHLQLLGGGGKRFVLGQERQCHGWPFQVVWSAFIAGVLASVFVLHGEQG